MITLPRNPQPNDRALELEPVDLRATLAQSDMQRKLDANLYRGVMLIPHSRNAALVRSPPTACPLSYASHLRLPPEIPRRRSSTGYHISSARAWPPRRKSSKILPP